MSWTRTWFARLPQPWAGSTAIQSGVRSGHRAHDQQAGGHAARRDCESPHLRFHFGSVDWQVDRLRAVHEARDRLELAEQRHASGQRLAALAHPTFEVLRLAQRSLREIHVAAQPPTGIDPDRGRQDRIDDRHGLDALAGSLQLTSDLVRDDATEAEPEQVVRPARLVLADRRDVARGDVGECRPRLATGHVANRNVHGDDWPIVRRAPTRGPGRGSRRTSRRAACGRPPHGAATRRSAGRSPTARRCAPPCPRWSGLRRRSSARSGRRAPARPA